MSWMGSAYEPVKMGLYIVPALFGMMGQYAPDSYYDEKARAQINKNIGNYKYTKGATKNADTRPYLYDVQKQRMVVQNGTMTRYTPSNPNSIFIKGGNYQFNYGYWELTVNLRQKIIMHFVYKGSITGMYP